MNESTNKKILKFSESVEHVFENELRIRQKLHNLTVAVNEQELSFTELIATSEEELEDVKKSFVQTDKSVKKLEEQVNEIDLRRNEIEDLKKTIKDLRQQIKDVDINKDEITYIFESDEITEFIEKKSEKHNRSPYFYVRGIPWYLEYNHSPGSVYLSVFLYAHNIEDQNWSINTNFEITILNQFGEQNRTNGITNGTFDNATTNLGFECLILIKELKNGFIKDDKLQILVHIKTDKLIRFN